MKFLVDENLPYDVASTAVEHGHSAHWVHDFFPGAPDSEVLARLRSTGEILVTRDIRFANLVTELLVVDAALAGVILIREQRLERIRKAWLRCLLAGHEPRGITVVTAEKMRFRRFRR